MISPSNALFVCRVDHVVVVFTHFADHWIECFRLRKAACVGIFTVDVGFEAASKMDSGNICNLAIGFLTDLFCRSE